jgi:hypothetical protein
MGEFNHFRELQQNGVATKMFRFKMSKMFAAARQGGFAGPEHVEILKGGACIGYTMLWCREQFLNEGVFRFARNGAYAGIFPQENGGVGMFGVRLQAWYGERTSAQTDESIKRALQEIGHSVGLTYDVANEQSFDDLDETMSYLFDEAVGGVYHLDVNMKVKGEETSHAIGVCKTQQNDFFVFDANCGEYQVKMPGLFAAFLEAAYAELVPGTRFQDCFICPVYLR